MDLAMSVALGEDCKSAWNIGMESHEMFKAYKLLFGSLGDKIVEKNQMRKAWLVRFQGIFCDIFE